MQTLQNGQSGALDWVVSQAQQYGLLAQWPQLAEIERLVGLHLGERLKRFGPLMADRTDVREWLGTLLDIDALLVESELTAEGDGLVAVAVTDKASPWLARRIESPGMAAVREALGIKAHPTLVLDVRHLPKPHEAFWAVADTVLGGEAFGAVDFSVQTAVRRE